VVRCIYLGEKARRIEWNGQMKILAINAGSSSVRLGAYEVGNGKAECLWKWREKISDHNPEQTLRRILLAKRSEPFDVAVHRLVHGGQTILGPSFADTKIKAAVEALVSLAPLHNRPFLAWLKAAEHAIGARALQVVVPDTGFYANLPDRARRYALPAELCEEIGIRRYGFHGIAHESMVRTWHAIASPPDPEAARLISLQLGSGCSVTATMGTAPVDTSMGYTPLEGLVMATRAGDLDPGIVLQLMQAGFDQNSISDLLNHQSGLLGLSGFSGDMRDLLSSSSSDARLAIEIYCYRARKYVGAYLAALAGADAILFGGGVGENSPDIRGTILDQMGWLGVEIDNDQNRSANSLTRQISTKQSRIAVWVIRVDEEQLMTQAAYDLVQGIEPNTTP
jgi:acetate kinase